MNYRLIIAFTATILFSPLVTGQSIGGKHERPANVLLEPLAFQALKTSIDTVGTAEAQKSVGIFPAASDVVTAINFIPGDFVGKDQILLKLDNRRQAIAVERAKIELLDAERTLKRLKESKGRGAVTQSDVDDAITQKDLAAVQLESAKTELEDRLVRAPFSGHVGLTDVEPGDRISTSTLITTIDDRKKLYVNFAAPETAIGMLSSDVKVLLEPWNNRGTAIEAEIAQLDSRININDRTMRVRAILDNNRDEWRPGLSFKVTLQMSGKTFPLIPEAALAWGATGAYVWIARNGKAEREPVTIVQRLRGSILVEGKLIKNESLVVEGIQRLRPGQALQSATLAVKSGSDAKNSG